MSYRTRRRTIGEDRLRDARGLQPAQGVFARGDPDEGVVAVPVAEPVEPGGGAALDAEHRVQSPRRHVAEQDEGEVSAVEDHDVAGREGAEMGARGGALVGAGREEEVGRHAAAEAVKTGQQALRIAGAAARERVSGLGERPRQVDFGAVDGEGPVPVPVRAVRVAGEDPAVRVAEHVLVHAGPGLGDRGDGHRLRLRQRDAEAAALVPQLRHGWYHRRLACNSLSDRATVPGGTRKA